MFKWEWWRCRGWGVDDAIIDSGIIEHDDDVVAKRLATNEVKKRDRFAKSLNKWGFAWNECVGGYYWKPADYANSERLYLMPLD